MSAIPAGGYPFLQNWALVLGYVVLFVLGCSDNRNSHVIEESHVIKETITLHSAILSAVRRFEMDQRRFPNRLEELDEYFSPSAKEMIRDSKLEYSLRYVDGETRPYLRSYIDEVGHYLESGNGKRRLFREIDVTPKEWNTWE